MMDSILTLMTFIPLLGAAVILCLPRDADGLIKWTALIATVPPLILAVLLFIDFDRSNPGFQYQQQVAWIPSFHIHYAVGVDGLSITMVLLTALLWGVIGVLIGVPLISLVTKAGFVVVASGGQRERAWSAAKAWDVVRTAPSEFAEEFQWTLVIALAAAARVLENVRDARGIDKSENDVGNELLEAGVLLHLAAGSIGEVVAVEQRG